MRDREFDLPKYEQAARHATYGEASAKAQLTPCGVLHQLEMAEKMASEGHAVLDRLCGRLEPVIETTPEVSRANMPPREPTETSQVGQRLESVVASLRELVVRIEGLTSRTRL